MADTPHAPRGKKTFRLPSKSSTASAKPPPPPWKSAGQGQADVYYDLEGAFYSMQGMKALQDNIALLPVAAQDAAGYEMANIAADVITDAKDNYVPVKLDHLRPSGRSDEYVPGRGIGITEIGMWFGGPPDLGVGDGGGISGAEVAQAGLSTIDPSEYALIQHEDLTFNHPNGGGPKYLERPLLAAVPTVLPRLARAIGEALGINSGFTEFALGGPGPDTGQGFTNFGLGGGQPGQVGLGSLGG